MIYGVQKSTYVNADERTTKALTYDILYGIYTKIDELAKNYEAHLGACETRFRRLENRKRKDTTVAAASGVGGGFLAVVAYWIKQLFD